MATLTRIEYEYEVQQYSRMIMIHKQQISRDRCSGTYAKGHISLAASVAHSPLQGVVLRAWVDRGVCPRSLPSNSTLTTTMLRVTLATQWRAVQDFRCSAAQAPKHGHHRRRTCIYYSMAHTLSKRHGFRCWVFVPKNSGSALPLPCMVVSGAGGWRVVSYKAGGF